MSAIFPVIPLDGVSPTAYVWISIALGLFFGFFLERAGFGSARNLTSIFVLRDFRVFRVMFSAVVTAMLGSRLLAYLGLLDLSLVGFDPTYFWAMAGGGLLFGVGFYVGGFCPGTAVVALARGRWDGLAFLLGIVLGIYGFALLFDAVGTEAWFASFYAPEGARQQTIYGDGPSWPWVAGLTAVALVAFRFVPFVEKRFALRTVEQLEAARAGRPVPPAEPPRIRGLLLRVGAPLAGVAALAVAALELSRPEVARPPAPPGRPAAVAADDEAAPRVDPLTLAGWVVAEAHRRQAEEPADVYVLDVRAGGAAGRIPGAERVDLRGADGPEAETLLLGAMASVAPGATSGRTVVLVDEDGRRALPLVDALRRRGLSALALEGGYRAWRERVVSDRSVLPLPTLRAAAAAQETAATPVEGEAAVQGEAAPVQGEAATVQGEAATVQGEAATELPDVDLEALGRELRAWLAGEAEGLPPRLALPGVVPPTTKAATVRARGAGRAGCG